VVGGGIIGVSVARRLLEVEPTAKVTLLEKEPELALHQTGRNSGVVHAGLYYPPGSLKARLCRRGVGLLRQFCADHGLTYEECGKVLVALDGRERDRLVDIRERAIANGVPDVRLLDRDELRAVEPHADGVAALHSPSTAIVDYRAITMALAAEAQAAGATICTGVPVTSLAQRGAEAVLGSPGGSEAYDLVFVCGGLHSDRLARLVGDEDDPRIVPFRGEYYLLRPDRRRLVRGLIYPVPDPRYPFLGVHLTRRADGDVMVGPNAVLALAREAYDWRTVSRRDLAETLTWPGFRTFARRNWRTGLREVAGSLSRRRFVSAARRYVPELSAEDVVAGPSGIRAQALGRDGALVDDFRISRRGGVVSVRNAASPGATSSLAIAEHVVQQALDNL
jgi:L-2-hydroxyglutarate oxidase LhgO